MDAATVLTLPHPTTPPKKTHRRSRCINCPCQDFASDQDVTSAIESNTRTAALIDWLSGKHRGSNDNATSNNFSCTNRLHASIVILNAIRDACRFHLESSTVASPHPNDKPANKIDTKNQQAVWEDSFPALSSAASTVTPTILFGRKKEQGDEQCARNTNNGKPKQQPTVNNSKTKLDFTVKKKIKPVTISLSAATTTSAWGKSNGLQGNIASLPSQPLTTESAGNGIEKSAAAPNTKEANSKAKFVEAKSLTVCVEEPDGGIAQLSNSNSQIDAKKSEEQLTRLVDVYATILKNQLAPYLLLEIHLLLRLISIADGGGEKLNDASIPFAAVFHSSESCRTLGAQTLSAIEPLLLNLGHDTLKMLASLDTIQTQCPSLAFKLRSVLENSTLLFESGEKALGANANTPHITLPFDHARDSRHNYRSADRNRLFKEREELRDSFLFQLRAFQDVRGRLMEEDVSSKIISNIEMESRKMVQNVAAGNIEWFVNFFCDLLLQIGLVPIGETDSDVLRQVADQRRLQKLHMRFTSRGGQTNKRSSSRKLTIDQTRPSSSDTSLPKQYFRGHQEFFALFLNAADSYKFNTHLKRRLAQLVTEMTAVNETKGLCNHLAKTRMLAKFLGLLVFSPDWTFSGSDSASDTAKLVRTGGTEIPPIDLKRQVEMAWKDYRLVIVIPWVVEFLKMMTWDLTSKKNQNYIDLFAVIWSIHKSIHNECLVCVGCLQTNMLLLSLQLAPLFNDVIGIVNAWNLPAVSLPSRALKDTVKSNSHSTNNSPLDAMPLWFSKSFLLSAIPHFEDLFDLVNDFHTSNNSSSKSGASGAKKVKPHSISGGPLKCFVESNSWQRFSPLRSLSSPMMSNPWSSSRSTTTPPSSQEGIKDKLIDCFFHQHKDLQQICETTIDRLTRSFSESILQGCVSPVFRDATNYEDYFNRTPCMELDEYIVLLQSLDVDANLKARAEMNREFSKIRETLELLALPSTNAMVRDIASTLAIQHACEKGDQLLRSYIREEKKKLVDEFRRKERKVKAGVPLKAVKYQHRPVALNASSTSVKCIVDLTTLLKNINNADIDEIALEQLKRAKKLATDHMSNYFIGREPSPCIRDFEVQLVSMLKGCFSSDESSSTLLRVAIECTDVLCLLGKMGYLDPSTTTEIESVIGDINHMGILMRHGTTVIGEVDCTILLGASTIGTFLFRLIDGSIVGHSFLEDALIKFVSNCKEQYNSYAVLEVLLDQLANNSGFGDWKEDGFVLMIRLQKMIKSDKVKSGCDSR